MGSGSQVSVVSADFVLLNSSLDSLTSLLDISRRVFNRTKLNFAWALVFNVVCLRESRRVSLSFSSIRSIELFLTPFSLTALAAGVFYAAGGVKLAPVWR